MYKPCIDSLRSSHNPHPRFALRRLKCWSTNPNCVKRSQRASERASDLTLNIGHMSKGGKGVGMARLRRFPPLDGGGPDKDEYYVVTEEERRKDSTAGLSHSLGTLGEQQKKEGTAAAKQVAEGQRQKKKKRRGSVVEMLSAIAGIGGRGSTKAVPSVKGAGDDRSTKDLSMALQIKRQMTDKRKMRTDGNKAKKKNGGTEERRGSIGSIAKSLSNALGFNMFK